MQKITTSFQTSYGVHNFAENISKLWTLLISSNLRIDISHKHLYAIYFKHAPISQLPDFVATQQFHSSRAFVEVIAERNAAVPALDFTRARP